MDTDPWGIFVDPRLFWMAPIYDRWDPRWQRLRAVCLARGMTDRWMDGGDKLACFDFAAPVTGPSIVRCQVLTRLVSPNRGEIRKPRASEA